MDVLYKKYRCTYVEGKCTCTKYTLPAARDGVTSLVHVIVARAFVLMHDFVASNPCVWLSCESVQNQLNSRLKHNENRKIFITRSILNSDS